MQDSVECFAPVQAGDITCSCFIQHCNPILEGHQIYQAQFTLSEAMLTVSNHHLFFHVPQHSVLEDLLHDLAKHKGKMRLACVPWVFLFFFFKSGNFVSPFSRTGNFTGLPQLLRQNGKWLSHFIRHFPQDLWMHLLRFYGFVHLQVLKIFSFIRWLFHFPVSDFSLCNSVVVAGALDGEVQGKKITQYLIFSKSHVTMSLISFQRGPTFSLVFVLSPVYLQNLFLLPLVSLARFKYLRVLFFLTSSLAAQAISLHFFQTTCPSCHPLQAFVCLFEFAQEHLVHPCRLPGIFAELPLWDASLLNLKNMILEYQPGFLSLSSFQGFIP